MDSRSLPQWLHLLNEFDGSEGRAADDQENDGTLFRVSFLDFCPFGTNWQKEKKTMFRNKKQQAEGNENSTHPVSDRRRGCVSDR